MNCVFCESSGGLVLWQDALCRVVRASELDYPALCRVIWQRHVKEMTDLSDAERAHTMRVVFVLERALRELLQPDKMNIASLANAVPHLHWHVVPRFRDDRHFPDSIWAAPRQTVEPRPLPNDFDAMLRKLLEERITPTTSI